MFAALASVARFTVFSAWMPNAPAACSMFQHVCRIWSSDWRPGERGKATSEQRLGAAVCHGVRTRSAAQRQKHRDSRKPNARQSESDSSSEDEAELETFLKKTQKPWQEEATPTRKLPSSKLPKGKRFKFPSQAREDRKCKEEKPDTQQILLDSLKGGGVILSGPC